jgi:hypothetical protein
MITTQIRYGTISYDLRLLGGLLGGVSRNFTLLRGLPVGVVVSYSYHTPLIFLFNFLGGGLIRLANALKGAIELELMLPASDSGPDVRLN